MLANYTLNLKSVIELLIIHFPILFQLLTIKSIVLTKLVTYSTLMLKSVIELSMFVENRLNLFCIHFGVIELISFLSCYGKQNQIWFEVQLTIDVSWVAIEVI